MKADNPKNTIDAQWAEEAESRIDAYDRGELGSVSMGEVVSKYTEWHRDELLQREAECGDFSDWSDAKQEIRDRVSLNDELPALK